MNIVNEEEEAEKEEKVFKNIEIKEEIMDDSIEFERIENMDTLNET